MILWPTLLMLGLLFISVPVAIALIAPSLLYFYIGDAIPIDIFAQRLVSSTESFPLLALPFFVIAGAIMNASGITRRLLNLADAFVGHMVGGLAQVAVILSALLGGLTASANADAAMLSKMLGPTMVERGYPRGFAAAIVASASIIIAMIPPGIGLIIYAFMANVSVGKLFMAGIVPGLVITIGLMVMIYFTSSRRGFLPTRQKICSGRELFHAFRDAIWALSVPAFIVIGLRYGLFTPTEAGAVVVVYAIFIGTVCHRELHWNDIPDIIRDSVITISVVMLIICGASAFGYYMVWEQIPVQVANAMVELTDNPLLLLLLVNLMLLAIGMVIEGTAAIILLTPILVPVTTSLGIDPVHFGIIMVLNLTMGGITPPVGTLCFTTSSALNTPITETFREILPMLAVLLIILAMVTLIPGISLLLPNALMGS